ncbi:MAG: anion permease [Methanocalculus sp. MSAO_Arc1]|uniref:inorganic phosphate transporter n=1 Tax=Methanocalculus TaxID=71151 RepID=UPI000FF38033|nr:MULTISPECIES: inorganic phosphate transporter [unclassified Methanocalculus]MCP1662491.1 PiT family inorganic phosphate transporter [Methanocalculus sp. AMF5]RQD80832.1 MAG: anion permease [Methanocalculus sp. MSAO_Arc1]
MELLIIAGIALALLFNFVNGLNDAANVIATVVATRALTPLKAIVLAAFFTLVGPFLFSTAVAKTVGTAIVNPDLLTPSLVVIGLVGAVFWLYFCSHFGIPVSASHSLVGGIMGAGIAAGGIVAVLWPTTAAMTGFVYYGIIGTLVGGFIFGCLALAMGDRNMKYPALGALIGFAFAIPISMLLGLIEIRGIFAVAIFIIISPVLGFIAAYTLSGMIMRFLSRAGPPRKMNNLFKKLQIAAASLHAIGHGANDAQNAMGIITAILLAAGYISVFEVPIWVILASCGAISLGTLLGGWRVIDKMAHDITKIAPFQGFSASTSGGMVLSAMSTLGIPVSTTHAITGAIMGAGSTQGPAAVRWGIVREIVAAWIITVPAAALVSYCFFVLLSLLF